MTTPEIIGKIPALAGPAPALGDVMRVRRAIDAALTVARELIANLDVEGGIAPGPEAAAVAYHLNRLRENTAGYASDYQAAELARLFSAVGENTEGWFGGQEFAAPLGAAVDNVDREIVTHEALTVPVTERQEGGTLDALLILAGLGLLAWALG